MLNVHNARLQQQLDFLIEIDRLKTVLRQSQIANGSRRENTAEHSWHLAMFALVLAEHAAPKVDALHVIRLLLVHDIVEIDAGDAPIHTVGANSDAQLQAETAGAQRIFGLLPADQATTLRALWEEFEAAQTPEARFAKSLDRLQPVLLNLLNGGGTWTQNAVTLEQGLNRYGPTIERGAPSVWYAIKPLIEAHYRDVSQP
jgi:putative hydrolases of HD superfamily